MFQEKEENICGADTVALEAWTLGRNIITTDLNPYAVLLTRAKLFPPSSPGEIISYIEYLSTEVLRLLPGIKIETVPLWVRTKKLFPNIPSGDDQ